MVKVLNMSVRIREGRAQRVIKENDSHINQLADMTKSRDDLQGKLHMSMAEIQNCHKTVATRDCAHKEMIMKIEGMKKEVERANNK